MSEALLSVVSLLTLAYLATHYTRESVEAPDTALPLRDLVDVRRYHHDGTQPTSERVGNRFPAVPWSEVSTLLPEVST